MTADSHTEDYRLVMAKHAKSFYLASLFFPKAFLVKVKAVYALCRWIDDAVDEAGSSEEARSRLQAIVEDLENDPSELVPNQMYKDNALDPGYVEDLVDGARDDLSKVRIADRAQLVQYSYKVAGTVGLAMNDLMGVEEAKARAFAVDLGIAMQITNICRDVREDIENDRLYLPRDLLDKHHIDAAQLMQLRAHSEAIAAAIRELLDIADEYYRSAGTAFVKIPFRMRGAIIIASRLYRGIGQKLLRQGGNPLHGRTYLTGPEKALLLAKGLGDWLVSGLRSGHIKHRATLHEGLGHWKDLRRFPS